MFMQPHRRYWDRWLMMGGIGVTTGFVSYLLYVVSWLVSVTACHQCCVRTGLTGTCQLCAQIT